MFTRTFVFLLLGSTLILANPIQDHGKNEVEVVNKQFRGVFGTVQSWLDKADATFGNIYDRVKNAVQMVVETGEGVMDYTKEKVEQLRYKYFEIKSKSEENLNTIKNTFILKVVGELQTVIDGLSKNADAETLEKLKLQTQELAQSSKQALETLQQQLQSAIEEEKKKLERNIDQWKQQANRIK